MKKINNMNKYLMFFLSYLGNALGNALTIKGAVGTFVWTSAFENIGAFLDVSVGTATSLVSLLFYVLSKLIGKDFNLKDATTCIFFSVFFGTLVDFFLSLFGRSPFSSIYANYILGLSGVFIISLSVSLAIKANVAFLALDDFIKNLKLYVFKGNVTIATSVMQLIGFAFAIGFGLLYGKILNMTLFTVIATACFGLLVSAFDKLFGFYPSIEAPNEVETSFN